jgi:hypothetical protein
MKCTIKITGQLNGNFTIKRKLQNFISSKERIYGRTIILEYETIKKAKEDIRDAYKKLKQEEPDYAKEGGIVFTNDSLTYDASIASIIKS